MNKQRKRNVVVIANVMELATRSISKMVGNDLSTRVDGQDVNENVEALVAVKLKERIALKVG